MEVDEQIRSASPTNNFSEYCEWILEEKAKIHEQIITYLLFKIGLRE